MRIKNFTAPDMPTALAQVREMLGADAVIISQEKNAAGEIELTAAVEDADEISFNREEQVEVRPTRWKYDDEKLRESLDYHGVLDIVKERVLARCRKISAEENLTDEKKLLTRCFEEMFRFQDILDCRQPVKMFMGVPGSGKSTAIAKAATQAKLQKLSACIVSTDNVRAGANSQLQAFADILETDFRFVKTPRGLYDTVEEARQKYALVLIDTPGINPFLSEEVEKVSLLTEAVRADMILTMDAGKNTFEAVEIADIFAEIGARFLLPTRLDLTRRIGALLSVAACCEFGFCSASVSSSIAKGLSPVDGKALAKLVLS